MAKLKNGHAPDHLRDAFCNWLDTDHECLILDIQGDDYSLRWLVKQLWHCTDRMPRGAVEAIEAMRDDRMQCVSYAAGARHLKAHLQEAGEWKR